ncbi:MAG: hypothetical protein EP314_01900 [Bacteroidetes bacterium]|nr:MAG: hypothetical protein EP314_01900 [Bacteroidota bacterium]
MKQLLQKSFIVSAAISGTLLFGSWTGGPAPESKSDSLAIVRVVRPINELFHIKPVVYVSKGLGKIDQVQMTDGNVGGSELVLKQTLTDLLTTGYTIQSATESTGNGMQLNTYYLKKKVI